ncbi:twitching motility protein PilT [Pararhizobium polonicum]|uniref:Ribonuclease VapC n=1 Tax=Pararhizobium polonicum TaxID=1612624 RepID=A0A1C7NW21_9HYPH|nr:type II toxin-antitoxin system VapC family toxin [Pararhizobium polonicum]OBZ93192.1 twitching motility protein PilT [Pararhizobium polonicum]
MKYILDTNVISEFRKAASGRCHPRVKDWVETVDPEEMYLSVITLMELEVGYLSLRRRDQLQAVRLKAWISDYIPRIFRDRILVFDEAVALVCAGLHVPDKRPERDAIIAATALCYGLTVVTRNTRDFIGTGVRLLNPWES